ncbi:DciA family protein [Streptomyces triculaminicus]|uniref:DciA family protein n=1 Tax=Streptomyces triculaminicus TaxID=2816232 RepID=UPI0037D7137F
MTEQTTTDQAGSGDGAPELSGLDLARVALQQARLAAKSKGAGDARVPRRRRPATVKRDGREPSGFAAVLAGLMADRAWELPATGGSILDCWPDIAATIAPQLPHHVAAVAFHPETGRLDLRPDSPAYGTQLRLLNARIVAAANAAAGTQAVRSIRVLAAGTVSREHTVEAAPAAPATSQAPVKTREMASPGFHQALAAHQSAVPARRIDPAIAEAVERQTAAMRELSRRAFPDTEPADVPAPIEAVRLQRRRQAAATEAAALRRARAERVARRSGTTAVVAQPASLRSTA